MEPERRIEKLLRAFAKKRRDQAGAALELRPAARQRLQQEISRHSTAKSGGGFLANLFLAFRPRLAFALCSIAIVCIGGWFFMASLGEKKRPVTTCLRKYAEPGSFFEKTSRAAACPRAAAGGGPSHCQS